MTDRLEHAQHRERHLHTRRDDLRSRLHRTARRLDEVGHRIEGIHHDRDRARHSYDPHGFDGCPVSLAVLLTLTYARKHGAPPFTVISADRRDGIAQKFGHESQLEAWQAYQNGTGLPANPPLTSTHEYRNGGTSRYGTGTPAFPTSQFAVGASLPPWALGIDCASNEQAQALVRWLSAHGFPAFNPYLTGTELHHFCLKADPLKRLIEVGAI